MCENASPEDKRQNIEFFTAETLQVRVLLLYKPVRAFIELHDAKWVGAGECASQTYHIVRIFTKKQQNNFSEFENPHLHQPDPNRVHSSYPKQDSKLLS